MATLGELEKKKTKTEADFESAKDELQKVVKAALAIKDPGKLVAKLKTHVMEALRSTIKAGEDVEDADDKLAKAAKAAGS